MKKSTIIALGSLVILGLVSCQDKSTSSEKQEERVRHESAGSLSHWSYQGETSPEHWAEIEKDSDCGGQHQSPINLIGVESRFTETDLNELEIDYYPETLIYDVHNNGHSIQFDFEQRDSIVYKGQTYYLRQIHFHEPSEHTINGMRFPIEVHLVHTSTQNEYAVISILGREGEDNERYGFFGKFLPLENGETKDINKPFDLRLVFPENDKEYFTYTGSLTTPPCTENVKWIVYRYPIVLSLKQVVQLKENMPANNYRNEQALNGRTVYKNF